MSEQLTATAARRRRYRAMRLAARSDVLRRATLGAVRLRTAQATRRFVEEAEFRLVESAFGQHDVDQLVAALRIDGYAGGLVLPRDQVEDVLRFACSTPCFADRDPALGFVLGERGQLEDEIGKPVLVAQYFNTMVSCAAVRQLANDPLLTVIAARHLGTVPRLVGVNLWWTFPVDATAEDRDRHAHVFHRDLDDFRFVKFFFYLTPVAVGDGGHVIVVRSQDARVSGGLSERMRSRRYGDDEVSSTFCPEDIIEIVGPPGTGFAEDTRCLHKGLTPHTSARLLLQFEFSVFDYGVAHDVRDAAALTTRARSGRK